MKTIGGNILNIKQGVICHQVNCKGVTGAGLALQIRNKWPGWYPMYRDVQSNLGDIYIYSPPLNDKLIIASLYAQDDYGTDKRHTNYAALSKCLLAVGAAFGDKKIYIPYGIGCGYGGGDWQIVKQIIADALPEAIVVKME